MTKGQEPLLVTSVPHKRSVMPHRPVNKVGHVLQQTAAQPVQATGKDKVRLPGVALGGGEVSPGAASPWGSLAARWDAFHGSTCDEFCSWSGSSISESHGTATGGQNASRSSSCLEEFSSACDPKDVKTRRRVVRIPRLPMKF